MLPHLSKTARPFSNSMHAKVQYLSEGVRCPLQITRVMMPSSVQHQSPAQELETRQILQTEANSCTVVRSTGNTEVCRDIYYLLWTPLKDSKALQQQHARSMRYLAADWLNLAWEDAVSTTDQQRGTSTAPHQPAVAQEREPGQASTTDRSQLKPRALRV